MANDFAAFAQLLRFVAQKTERVDADVAAMLDALHRIAEQIETTGQFSVPRQEAALTARGFAGVAGFLKERILPEATAHKNDAAIEQVNYGISTALKLSAAVLAQTETEASTDNSPIIISLEREEG